MIDTFTLSPLILTSEPVLDVSSFERRERSHFNNISDTDVSKSHDVKKKKGGPPPACCPRLCASDSPVAAPDKALPVIAYSGPFQVPAVTEEPRIQPFNQLMTRNRVGRPQSYSAALFLFVSMARVFYSFKLLVLYSFVLEKQN